MKFKKLNIDTSERDSHLEKKNGRYYFVNSTGDETELLGMHCKAYSVGQKYFFSFDAGGFVTRFVDVEMLESEFLSLRSGLISFDEIYNKYSCQA